MSKRNDMPAVIGGKEYAGMILSASNALSNQKELINKLNVYPVPDGDTGSNMSMTMHPAVDFSDWEGSLTACAEKTAGAFLRAARGNSGVILSLFFRGLSKGLKGLEKANASDLFAAFGSGVKEAYKAVQYPREGTILTVMRSCTEIDPTGCDPLSLLDRMYDNAAVTLEKTPEMLPVLKQAGVVDSGGKGFLEILDGMRLFLRGTPVQAEKTEETEQKADFASFDTENIVNPYCTECIITKKEEYFAEGSCEKFRKFVLNAGDSVVFAEDGEIIKIHVHTKDPGKVLSEAIKYGSLYTVKVENMRNQHTELVKEAKAEPKVEKVEKSTPTAVKPEEAYGFVAVTMGEGMKEVFADLGVGSFVSGGQTMNPSTEQLTNAVLQTPAKTVFLLPNNSNICLVASQVSRFVTDRKVVVIPSVSVPQGIAAMMQFDPDASVSDNEQNMKAALSSVKTLDVTYAAHDSSIGELSIKTGQMLGLVEHKVRYVSDDRMQIIEQMIPELADASFLTVFYGEDVTEAEAFGVEDLLKKHLPDAEIALIPGGQPLYYYVISAE